MAVTTATDFGRRRNEKTPHCGAFPVRPRGFEPPRAMRPTRPSTWSCMSRLTGNGYFKRFFDAARDDLDVFRDKSVITAVITDGVGKCSGSNGTTAVGC